MQNLTSNSLPPATRSRVFRLLAGINTPPVLGAFLLFLYIEIPRGFSHWEALIPLIGIGYLFVGLQAIVFACLFEFLILKRTENIVILSVSGAFFGAVSLGFFGIPFILIGAICGMVSALIMRKLKVEKAPEGAIQHA